MLENEIIACCKRLKLSRNLADMAQTTDGESHQEYLYDSTAKTQVNLYN